MEQDKSLEERAYLPAIEEALYTDAVDVTVYALHTDETPVYRNDTLMEQLYEKSWRDQPQQFAAYLEDRFQTDLDIPLCLDWQEVYLNPETVTVSDDELLESYGKPPEQFVNDVEAFLTQTPFTETGWGPQSLPDDLGALAEKDATLNRLHREFDEFSVLPYIDYLTEKPVDEDGVTIVAADFQDEDNGVGLRAPDDGTAYLNTGRIKQTYVVLEDVAAHELGHVFGLEHVHDCDDLMHPQVSGDRFDTYSQQSWEHVKDKYRNAHGGSA